MKLKTAQSIFKLVSASVLYLFCNFNALAQNEFTAGSNVIYFKNNSARITEKNKEKLNYLIKKAKENDSLAFYITTSLLSEDDEEIEADLTAYRIRKIKLYLLYNGLGLDNLFKGNIELLNDVQLSEDVDIPYDYGNIEFHYINVFLVNENIYKKLNRLRALSPSSEIHRRKAAPKKAANHNNSRDSDEGDDPSSAYPVGSNIASNLIEENSSVNIKANPAEAKAESKISQKAKKPAVQIKQKKIPELQHANVRIDCPDTLVFGKTKFISIYAIINGTDDAVRDSLIKRARVTDPTPNKIDTALPDGINLYDYLTVTVKDNSGLLTVTPIMPERQKLAPGKNGFWQSSLSINPSVKITDTVSVNLVVSFKPESDNFEPIAARTYTIKIAPVPAPKEKDVTVNDYKKYIKGPEFTIGIIAVAVVGFFISKMPKKMEKTKVKSKLK